MYTRLLELDPPPLTFAVMQTIALSGDGKGGALEGAVDVLLVLGITCPYLALLYAKLMPEVKINIDDEPAEEPRSRLGQLFRSGSMVALASAVIRRSNSIQRADSNTGEFDASKSGMARSGSSSGRAKAPKCLSKDPSTADGAGRASAKRKGSAKKAARTDSVEEETTGFGFNDADGDGDDGGYLEFAPGEIKVGDRVEVDGKVSQGPLRFWCA